MEANKSEYFVDGFLIKNFDIWPIGLDKNNLFEEQKIFLVYLMGVIPNSKNWNLNIEYQTRLNEINNLTEKDIVIDDTDIDIANLHGKSIDEIKKDRLKTEKEIRIKELNEKFGLEKKEKEKPKIMEFNEKIPEGNEGHEQLWDMLQGKAFKK